MSGSGVLLGGEMANGVITILGLSCQEEKKFSILYSFGAFLSVYSRQETGNSSVGGARNLTWVTSD